jgi:hypothetical protein
MLIVQHFDNVCFHIGQAPARIDLPPPAEPHDERQELRAGHEVVVFPAPLGPRKPKISPWAISNERLAAARTRPNDLPSFP